MRILLISLTLITAVIFLSCQKELTDPNGPTGTEQARKHLVKATYQQIGITLIDSFVYDNKERCTRYHETILGIGPDPYIYFYDFHYNGNDTLPYKITDTSEGRQMIWLVLYDTQNRKILDSLIFAPTNEKIIAQYSYSSNRIISTVNYSRDGVLMSSGKDTFDLDGNNCIAEASGNGRNTFSYDNRINPLSTINIAKSVLFGATTILGDFRGLNKNNITGMTRAALTPTQTNFQNSYDSDGYPVSSNVIVVGDPNSNGVIEYKYNK